MALSKFHIDTLTAIINCFGQYHFLLDQIPFLSIIATEHTGVGCFYNYELSTDFEHKINENVERVLSAPLHIESAEIQEGIGGIILYTNKGKIETLEIFTYTSSLPTKELGNYSYRAIP